MEDQVYLAMDSDVPDPIIRQASLYIVADDAIYIDNRLFEEDDIETEEDMDDDAQQVGTFHDVQFPPIVELPNCPMFEAPSVTFRSIDWTAANILISSGLHAPYSVWKIDDEFHKGLHFIDKIDLQTAVR